jgi:hypothetical protein
MTSPCHTARPGWTQPKIRTRRQFRSLERVLPSYNDARWERQAEIAHYILASTNGSFGTTDGHDLAEKGSTMSRKARNRTRVRGSLLLEPDESVVLVEHPSRMLNLPKYVFSLGLYGIWRKRDIAAVTNRRVILGRGLIRRDERSIPLARVRDASFVRHGLASYSDLEVTGRRGTDVIRIGPLAARRARAMTAKIGGHLLQS